MNQEIRFDNFIELSDHLHTEDDFRDWLGMVRWGEKPRCSHCGNNEGNYYLSTRKIYKCSDSDCRKQFSVTTGTIFERTRIPLKKWFCVMFELANDNISSCKLASKIGVNQKTAWKMMHKIRHLLSDENETTFLNGIVECDETIIGPRLDRDLKKNWQVLQEERKINKIYGEDPKMESFKRARNRKKLGLPPGIPGRPKGSKNKPRQKKHKDRTYYKYTHLVFGMVERKVVLKGKEQNGTEIKFERKGKVVLKKIGRHETDVKKENIEILMRKHISKQTRLMTDGSGLYKDASLLFAEHEVIIHELKKEYKTKDGKIKTRRVKNYVEGDVYTNSCENVWKHLKKAIGGKHIHVTYQHLDRYLAEFSFYWNRRGESNSTKFMEILDNSFDRTLPYSEFKMFTRIDKKRVILAEAA